MGMEGMQGEFERYQLTFLNYGKMLTCKWGDLYYSFGNKGLIIRYHYLGPYRSTVGSIIKRNEINVFWRVHVLDIIVNLVVAKNANATCAFSLLIYFIEKGKI